MFIVEGLDYAGKTTALELIRRIVREQRWSRWYGSSKVHEIQKWGKLPKDFDYCKTYIEAALGAQLCDRFVLSELAYGEVFRGGPNPKFDTHARRRVQRALNATGSVTLLVKADWATTERRAKERCLSEFDAAMKMRQTYDAGTTAFQHALMDITIGRRGGSYLGEYNTSDSVREPGISDAMYEAIQEDVLAWYVCQWQVHLERAQLLHRLCPQSWGYLWPKILFVGESVTHPTDSAPYSGDDGESRTFTELLNMAGIGEKDLYLWSAHTFRGQPLLTREGVTALQPKAIITLGRSAHEHLTSINIPHAEFPNPQWIGRFHRKEMNEWASRLKTLVLPALHP